MEIKIKIFFRKIKFFKPVHKNVILFQEKKFIGLKQIIVIKRVPSLAELRAMLKENKREGILTKTNQNLLLC